jgi:hypothetical protein
MKARNKIMVITEAAQETSLTICLFIQWQIGFRATAKAADRMRIAKNG